MTRKDMFLIAKAVRETFSPNYSNHSRALKRTFIKKFSELAKKDNPNFDQTRFEIAANSDFRWED